MVQAAVPGNTAIGFAHHAPDIIGIEINAGENFHRIGGTGGGGNGARRCFRNGQAVGGDNGDDDHRNAAARDAAHGVLVDDQVCIPVDFGRIICTGAGQVNSFVFREVFSDGNEKISDFLFAEAAGHDIADDVAIARMIKRATVDLTCEQ